MSEVPVELIVAAFGEEKAAKAALKELKAAKRANLIDIVDAAVIRRDEKNKLHIKETGDLTGGQGAMFGGALGLTLGILAGPGALVAGATGALIGGIASKLRDSGFSNKRLAEIGEALKPGTSAIVAVVEHKWVGELESLMAEAGADVLTETLKEEIATQLGEGNEIAFSAVSAEGVLDINKMVAGEDFIEADGVTISEDGITAQSVAVTEQGVTGGAVAITEEGAVAASFEGTFLEEEKSEEEEEGEKEQ
jgi:uncharacterized membrane protein